MRAKSTTAGRSIRRGRVLVAAAVTVAGLGLTAAPASAACGVADALDLDGDCVTEATEETAGTDAWDPDTDEDRLSDGYELSHGSDPLTPNSNADRFVRALLTDLGIPVTQDMVRRHTPAASTSQGRSALVRQLAFSDTYVRGVVDRFYQDTLGRGGDEGGVAYWTELLTSKQLTTAEAAGYFYASEEYFEDVGRDLDAWLIDLYDELLLRKPDADGFAHWKAVARAHGRASVAIPFYQAIETRRLRVRHLYQRFLGREADADGEHHWADVLLRTGDDVDLAVNLASSAEYSTRSNQRRWGTFGPEPPAVRIRRLPTPKPSLPDSYWPSISEDGRFVAFGSAFLEVYLWDRLTGETILISAGHDGSPVNGPSSYPVVSGDGNHVAFLSEASNLVPGDPEEGEWDYDVFVWDRRTRVTEQVSVSSDEIGADAPSDLGVDISHDGRFVAFSSYATNLAAAGTDDSADIFVRDRVAGTTEQISRSDHDSGYLTDSLHPTISDDGRHVAFSSYADDLVDDDGNGHLDVFLTDRSTGVTSLVSVGDHPGIHDSSGRPRVSGDGRYVAFASLSSQLVPGDTNGEADVFVWERESGSTRRVSMTIDGSQTAGGSSLDAAISRTGRYVSFDSSASNMTHDPDTTTDVYLWDSQTDSVSLVSRGRNGERADATSGSSSVTENGRFVVFDSNASNLVPGDDNGASDIFLWERPSG